MYRRRQSGLFRTAAWAASTSKKRNKEFPCLLMCPSRFHRGKQIGNYVGMIPSEDSSGGKQRLGHISKQGNSLLRFLLVEAAQAAVRNNPDWRRRYIHLAMRRDKSQTNGAVGARLGGRLNSMWAKERE